MKNFIKNFQEYYLMLWCNVMELFKGIFKYRKES